MSLPTLADPSDLELWLKADFSPTDWARADLVLDKVSELIRHEAGDLTWVDDDGALSDVPGQIPGLALEVAARVWDNPTFKSQSAGGPFSDSWGPAVGLFLTDEQRALLPNSVGTPSAFSINTIPAETQANPLKGAQVNGPAGWAPGECQW